MKIKQSKRKRRKIKERYKEQRETERERESIVSGVISQATIVMKNAGNSLQSHEEVSSDELTD